MKTDIMKTRILLSLLAAGVLLAACSKGENEGAAISGNDEEQLVPIRLSSGIGDASPAASKAPVTGNVSVQIEGWESSSAVSYASASTWQSTATVSTGASASSITLSPVRYYNANSNVTTYIKGWYPQAASSNGTVSFTNTDGSVDALYASAVSGSKSSAISNELVFNHQTAQISFKVQAGDGLADNTTLSSIKIKNAELPTGFDLTKTNAAEVVTYASAADLTVPGITTGATTISSTATSVGNAVMIKPISSKTFTIDVVTNNATYSNQTVTVNTNSIEAGTAYEVTLTFGQEGLSLQGNITPWVSKTGTGTLK